LRIAFVTLEVEAGTPVAIEYIDHAILVFDETGRVAQKKRRFAVRSLSRPMPESIEKG
jgi:hypothetical protein